MMKLCIFILFLLILNFDIFVVILIKYNLKKSKTIFFKKKFLGLSLEFKMKK